MVLCGLGVGERDGGAVVLAVEPAEVLVTSAQDQRHDLSPSSHGGLKADNIAQLVDGQGLGDGGGLVGVVPWESVEAVGDSDILHDVTLVQDVGTGLRDGDVEDVLVG